MVTKQDILINFAFLCYVLAKIHMVTKPQIYINIILNNYLGNNIIHHHCH